MIENFFKPKSVAVIGASGNKNKVGYSLVKNLLDGGTCEVYPVTLNEKEILGLKAFTSVLEIEEKIDLAIIAVHAELAPTVLADCGKKKIPNAIIISSGFKEVGVAGRNLEEKVLAIANESGIEVLGPNCLGVIDNISGLNASFSSQKPLPGKISLLSQSGALGTAMIDWAKSEGIGFSKFVSLGNEAQLTEIEFLEYLENDPDTSAILMYLENIKDGRKFMETVSRITPKKPVVIIKAGMGSHGNLAVMSHTGALAPQASVFIAACKQAGVVTVSSLRGFFNVVKLLSQEVSVNSPVQKLAILTNGGGPSVVAADLIDRSRSLSLVAFSEEVKEALKKVLPAVAAVGNPVDLIGDALAERYDKALQILSDLPDLDGIIVILTPQMMTEAKETAKVLAKYKNNKKIFPVFLGGKEIEAGREELIQSGMVCFQFPRDVIDGLDYIARNAAKIKPSSHHEYKTVPTEGQQMEFEAALELLSRYGISVSGSFIKRKEDLAETISHLGEGPYAMKAISEEAIHKTEKGAVRLNISNFGEAGWIWEELWTKIPAVKGIVIQKMEKGREVIIGMKRDNIFGPTLVFGLGGIFTEAIKDTVLRIAPVSREEALKMIREIKGVKILEGLRGEPPVNFDLLADIIANLSRLSLEHPEIKEIDLNPVMVTENFATITDARVII